MANTQVTLSLTLPVAVVALDAVRLLGRVRGSNGQQYAECQHAVAALVKAICEQAEGELPASLHVACVRRESVVVLAADAPLTVPEKIAGYRSAGSGA